VVVGNGASLPSVIFDISYPHDLRVQIDQPSITTEEIDALLADPSVGNGLKETLLADVEPQGYQRRGETK